MKDQVGTDAEEQIRLSPMQARAYEAFQGEDFDGLSVRDLAQQIFGSSEDEDQSEDSDPFYYDPGESELRAAYRAARALERKGLVHGNWVHVRDHGHVLVFGLRINPTLYGADPTDRRRSLKRKTD